jgi:hypothetical protein
LGSEGAGEILAFRQEGLKKAVLEATKKGPEGGGHWDLLALARATDAKISDLEGAIAILRTEGFDVEVREGRVVRDHEARAGQVSHFWRIRDGKWIRFGVLGDSQLGNRHQRLDVLQTAYDHYAAEGIDTVYHTGNLIDGYEARLNGFEILPEAGFSMESQAAYAAKVYPQKPGITTHFITGECHEGWWAKKVGINIGRFMESKFKLPSACEERPLIGVHPVSGMPLFGSPRCHDAIKAGACQEHGRFDLRYLGHTEADVEIRHEALRDDARGPIVRIIHPGGGTAYALSYTTQKLTESLQGGEKPQVQLVGHYHKYDCNYHREVYNLQTGCLCDQTIFMRKKNIAAHVGYLIVEMQVAPDGTPAGFRHQWVPFYDKGYYQRYETW